MQITWCSYDHAHSAVRSLLHVSGLGLVCGWSVADLKLGRMSERTGYDRLTLWSSFLSLSAP